MQCTTVTSLFSSPVDKDTQSCLIHCSDIKVSVLLHSALGTSVNATLSGEPTLRSAIGSQTQVPTLRLTLEDFTLQFCSDSQDIFLLNHEENHPLKQDFEAAAAIVFIILCPSGCGIVGGVEELMGLTEKENW